MSSPRAAMDAARPDEEPNAARGTDARPLLSLDIPRYVRVHVACIVVLVALNLAGQYARLVLHHDRLMGFVREFNLDDERNVPTWFQAVTLGLAAVLLETVARVRRSVADRGWICWRVLSLGFLLMSVDEAASLHENLQLPAGVIRNVPGFQAFSWVVPGSLLVIGLLAFFLPWLRTLPERTRNGLLLAGTVYVGGAVGLEAVGGIEAITVGLNNWIYVWTYTIEETLEMAGTLLLILTLFEYLRSLRPVPALEITNGPRPAVVAGATGLPAD